MPNPRLDQSAKTAAGQAQSVDNNMRTKNILLTFLSLLVLTGVFFGGRFYYVENTKYANLEKTLSLLHEKMESDFPKEQLEKAEHFGAGLSIRNTYNLWAKNSAIRVEFEKAGVTHPDDMSSLIMETYVRAKKGVPFKLHRLINLQQAVYDSKDKQEPLKKLADEFYIYEQYRKVQR